MESSTAPGQTPLHDVSGLKLAGIKSRADLLPHEAENVRQAHVKYLAARPSRRLCPFDLPWLKKLHRDMLGNVWKWAGRFRQSETNLGVPPHQIEVSLVNLLADLKTWGASGMSLLEQATHLHYRAVHIHPFQDGNGRWARLLANIWSKQNGGPVVVWLEETIGAESVIRSEYLAAVKQADQGDLEPLVALHERYAEPKPGRG